ncbi:IpaD/SipD/SspD family type III secretion system needle tip protein [Stenotrophomonas sp.]|uniref:IpaD/SipD/SspD family type III secretion system needle tip protein n=1 Tax=Stenotrophomonas sp. TaxID=69392 RepID=UPI002FC7E233
MPEAIAKTAVRHIVSTFNLARTDAADAAKQTDIVAPDSVDPETLRRLRVASRMLLNASRQANRLAAWVAEQPHRRLDDPATAHLAMLRQGSDLAMHDAQRSLEQLGQHLGLAPPDTPVDPATMDASGLVWGSHAEFYDQIMKLLGLLQQEWLAKYQDAMSKFLEFYTEFSDIMEQLKPVASGDKGDVAIDFRVVRQKLEELIAKYDLPSHGLASFKTQGEADAFIKSIGLPGLTVTADGGAFVVKMDLTAVTQLKDSMEVRPPPFTLPIVWDSARYNAWVSSRDSNMEQIKHVSKVLGEKLSEMTQKFDNIVKILSSTVDKITEADMSFVNGL